MKMRIEPTNRGFYYTSALRRSYLLIHSKILQTHPVEYPNLPLGGGLGHAMAVVVEQHALLLSIAPQRAAQFLYLYLHYKMKIFVIIFLLYIVAELYLHT